MRNNTPVATSSPATERTAPDALELLLHDNRISRLQREILERPENYGRPIRISRIEQNHDRHSRNDPGEPSVLRDIADARRHRLP
jgi:hypothetical protein